MTHELSWPAANLRRLQRHALLTPAPSGTDPAEIAAVICGAHAQVLSAAELSLALRIQAGTPTTVRQVLWKEHRLIKTSGPRGTVHLLATDDLPMWMAALSAIPAHSPFPDGVRLTPEQAEARASRAVHESTRWTPGFRLASPDKGRLAMIITHYLYAYGPATPQQFARRIGAPPSWAAEQFELHSRRLTKINFDGSPARQ